MDQLEKLRHNVDELTLTAKSRARVASEVGLAVGLIFIMIFVRNQTRK